MVSEIKAVIGANYGDEGKGLMTDFFCRRAADEGRKCLVICTNGGAQRGHTVTPADGRRHVFSHFGSGSFAGADTYLPETYILNPILFREEYGQLAKKGCTPRVYAHHECMWSTPYDMITNRIIEDSRGENRHGSCGLGIWETVLRYRTMIGNLTMSEFNSVSMSEKKAYLSNVKSYFMKRLDALGIKITDEKWLQVLSSEYLAENFIEDVSYMAELMTFTRGEITLSYDTLVFENGQGLLLDEKYSENPDNTTPSNTGSENIAAFIAEMKLDCPKELCYVTRTYMTRHGAGSFDGECPKSDINADMTDETNVPNDYQGTLRYGRLDVSRMIRRVKADSQNIKDASVSLAVTHMNETNGKLFTAEKTDKGEFDFLGKIYASDGRLRESVREITDCFDILV